MTLQGASTTFNINKDGSYTIETDGGMAHFIAIRAQGTLSASQLKSFENGLAKMQSGPKLPANLPGIVPGSGEFTITWDGGSVSGAVNAKGAIDDAKQNGQDVSAWKLVEPMLTKFQSSEAALEKAYNPTAVAPDKKAPFDSLSIEEHNSWTGGVDKLTVKPDGSYTLERSLGQSTLTGTLTADQLASLTKAYKQNTLAADNGKMIGGLIPDDTQFTITASEGGKTYSVNGSVDSSQLGPLQAIEKALVGDVNGLQPPVAKPIAAPGDDTGPKLGVPTGPDHKIVDPILVDRGARSTGMSKVLTDRVKDGSADADGKGGDAAKDR
jgi:hypothetical protein